MQKQKLCFGLEWEGLPAHRSCNHWNAVLKTWEDKQIRPKRIGYGVRQQSWSLGAQLAHFQPRHHPTPAFSTPSPSPLIPVSAQDILAIVSICVAANMRQNALALHCHKIQCFYNSRISVPQVQIVFRLGQRCPWSCSNSRKSEMRPRSQSYITIFLWVSLTYRVNMHRIML